MEMPKESYDMICEDIKRIEEVDSLSSEEEFELHRELDGRYQACIQVWYKGFRGTNSDETKLYYNKLENFPDQVRHNLKMMKAKLEAYKRGMNAVSLPEPSATNITVNNNLNITLSFTEAKQRIEDMTALNREQTDEILAKIDELEKISKENISRKSKWEKIKPIVSFALDKGADVAIAFLSLVLQMKLDTGT